MTSIQQNPFSDLLENSLQSFLKEKIELMLREEIKNYLAIEHPEEPNTRNGYYSRTWETRHGLIPDLQVPGIGKASSRRSSLSLTSAGKHGSKIPSSTCTKEA